MASASHSKAWMGLWELPSETELGSDPWGLAKHLKLKLKLVLVFVDKKEGERGIVGYGNG